MDLLAPLRRVCDDPWSVVSMPELSGMASWWLRRMIVQTGWSNLPSQGVRPSRVTHCGSNVDKPSMVSEHGLTLSGVAACTSAYWPDGVTIEVEMW